MDMLTPMDASMTEVLKITTEEGLSSSASNVDIDRAAERISMLALQKLTDPEVIAACWKLSVAYKDTLHWSQRKAFIRALEEMRGEDLRRFAFASFCLQDSDSEVRGAAIEVLISLRESGEVGELIPCVLAHHRSNEQVAWVHSTIDDYLSTLRRPS